MRVTAHNGRAGKDGAYSAKHNDRNFDVATAQHIDQDRSSGNWYWRCDGSNNSFDQVEHDFYVNHFGQALEEKNQRYIKQGHKERTQTIDDYRTNPRSCPEETILQIGKEGQTVDPALLKEICMKQITWEAKAYPNARILDVALHVDEQGAPHMHMRKVWIGHDKDGNEVVGQEKALKEMGIKAPDKDKAYGRHNNAKMTYTASCRDHLVKLCLQYELDIDLEPKEASKSGLSLIEYKRQQEQEKLQQAQENNKDVVSQLAQKQEELQQVEENTINAKKALEEVQNALQTSKKELQLIDDKRERLGTSTWNAVFGREHIKVDKEDFNRALDMSKNYEDRLLQLEQRQQDLDKQQQEQLQKQQELDQKESDLAQQQRDLDLLIQQRVDEKVKTKTKDITAQLNQLQSQNAEYRKADEYLKQNVTTIHCTHRNRNYQFNIKIKQVIDACMADVNLSCKDALDQIANMQKDKWKQEVEATYQTRLKQRNAEWER